MKGDIPISDYQAYQESTDALHTWLENHITASDLSVTSWQLT